MPEPSAPHDETQGPPTQGADNKTPQDEATTVSPDVLSQSIVSMAVETWRISKVFDRVLLKLEAGEQARYSSQFRWFTKKVHEALETAGLRMVNVEGQRFDPGMAATPVNIAEFDAESILVVEQMLEPIIIGKEGLVRPGTVTLVKVES